MPGERGLRLLWEVLRAEGPAAVADRFRDRLAAARRRLAFRTVGAIELDRPGGEPRVPPVTVLHLLPTPPRPDFGGLQQQLLRRLAGSGGGSALLYPDAGGYRLEVAAAGRRVALRLGGAPAPDRAAFEDAAFERAVERAAEAVTAGVLHVEGVAGLPPISLRRLAEARRVVLSLHDFGAFCLRPHLLEEPARVFCRFSRDDRRCQSCLAADGGPPLAPDYASERRRHAAEALGAATAAVFPSSTLLDHHRELFPGALPDVCGVIPPAVSVRPRVVCGRLDRPLRRLAVVGSVGPHKGSALVEPLLDRLAGERSPLVGLDVVVLGGGDRPTLSRLRRRPGVRVRGYYRAGALPDLLARESIDLALLLSIWPETYGITFDECVLAGVPAVAFDHGAIAERARRWGGALLVPPGEGVEGIAAAVERVARGGTAAVPATSPSPAIPDGASAVAAMQELYRRIGVVGE